MLLVSVNHHYIRDAAPPRGIHPISLNVFQQRVAMLRAAFHIVTEQQLVDSFDVNDAAEGDGKPRLLLTFDDGLAEQMSAAFALNRLGIAAVFFVPTAPLIDTQLLTVHKTHLLRSVVPDERLLEYLEKRFGERVARIDLAAAARQYIYDTPGAQHVKYILNFVLTPADCDAFINDAFDRYCGSATAAARQLYMSRDDIRWLADHGMLGTHAHSHRALAQLAPPEIEREISLSTHILKDITGRDVRGISYPYGGGTAVSDDVYRAARQSGLRYGLTMSRGGDSFPGTDTPFALHRYDTRDTERLLVGRTYTKEC
jgi:peptidoglycan/xylan/chitin deacetylase (PgdA/CDA1 family)